MEAITIDGMHEDAFRLLIEDMLRRGRADEAAVRLRRLMADYAGEGLALPAGFLSARPEDIEISGWEALDEGLKKFDRAENPVTAISLSFGDADGRRPVLDASGRLTPIVETSYFSDEAFPFSESDRNDLLDGYSTYGCQWAGDCEGVDNALSFTGLDDLHIALMELEQRLLATPEPAAEDICAGTVASCFLAILIHQALRAAASKRQMGRPLCVLTASNGVYPSFDSPVLSCDEYLSGGEVVAIEAAQAVGDIAEDCFARAHAVEDDEAPEEASLLSIGIRRAAKQPVLALTEDEGDLSFDDMAQAALGGMAGQPPFPPLPPVPVYEAEEQWAEPADPEPVPEVQDVFEDPASFVELEPEPEVAIEAPVPEAPASADDSADAALPEIEDIPAAAAPPLSPPPPLHERQMGDTEWPAHEVEETAELAAEPEVADLPPVAAPRKLESVPENHGHSLRARLTVAEDEPEPSLSRFALLLDRLLRMLKLRA